MAVGGRPEPKHILPVLECHLWPFFFFHFAQKINSEYGTSITVQLNLIQFHLPGVEPEIQVKCVSGWRSVFDVLFQHCKNQG